MRRTEQKKMVKGMNFRPLGVPSAQRGPQEVAARLNMDLMVCVVENAARARVDQQGRSNVAIQRP
jgi:AmiR/NasT family two-component response regulator